MSVKMIIIMYFVSIYIFKTYESHKGGKDLVTSYTLINYTDLDSPMISSHNRLLTSLCLYMYLDLFAVIHLVSLAVLLQ